MAGCRLSIRRRYWKATDRHCCSIALWGGRVIRQSCVGWMRRRLRNFVHLTESGCLGPCALANVAMLLFDGEALWFHSMNSDAEIVVLFDYVESRLAAAGPIEVPEGLAQHLFTANTWQPRPDGQAVDDGRPWPGSPSLPDATPACELPDDSFIPANYGCELRDDADDGPVSRAIAAMEGVGALPRTNGELVFAEPWHGRAFGLAVGLHDQGLFAWETFRTRLVANIAEAEKEAGPFEYYRCWLAALEDVLDASGVVSPAESQERTFEFEFGERQEIF